MSNKIVEFAETAGFSVRSNQEICSPYVEDSDLTGLLTEYTKNVVTECIKLLLEEGNEKSTDAIWDLGEKFDVDVDAILDEI
jgi:hypothetical protein